MYVDSTQKREYHTALVLEYVVRTKIHPRVRIPVRGLQHRDLHALQTNCRHRRWLKATCRNF